ncbi:MAG: DUF4810 domain-containing protein [Lautropia sp.]
MPGSSADPRTTRAGTARAVPVAILATALVALAGCAATPDRPRVDWGSYQRALYAYLRGDTSTPAEQLAALQAQAARDEAAGAALAPGFRAHLALLQLQLGRADEARRLIEAEKAAFPESARYMDFVLGTVGGR